MKVPASTSRKSPLGPPYFPSRCLFGNFNGSHRAWRAALHPLQENRKGSDLPALLSRRFSARHSHSASWSQTTLGRRRPHPNPAFPRLAGGPQLSPVPGGHPPGCVEAPRAGKAGSHALPEPARLGGRLAGRRLLPVASPRGPAPGAWPKGRLSGRPSPCVGGPGLARWDYLLWTRGAALRQP